MSFQVNPNDFLGQLYSDHCSKCYSLALSDPKTFYNVRSNVTRNLKREIVKDFYDKIFLVLSTGNTVGTTSVYKNETGGVPSGFNAAEYKVAYPTQKINEIALSFSSTLDKMLDEIASIILPDKINRVVEDKLSNIGKSTLPL